jgi:hypothetical protein
MSVEIQDGNEWRRAVQGLSRTFKVDGKQNPSNFYYITDEGSHTLRQSPKGLTR